MIRVEPVDPLEFAGTAAGILTASWPPPCLRYTPAYLRWQMGFPGERRPAAVAAFDGPEAIGFAAVTPRRVSLGAARQAIYVLSFVAVRPDWRGRGIALRLYAALLENVRGNGLPLVVFVENASPGEQTLLRAAEASRLVLRGPGVHSVYGYLARPGWLAPAVETEVVNPECVLPLLDTLPEGRTLWSTPDESQLWHLDGDPRPSAMIVARRQAAPVAAARVVRADVVTAQGAAPSTMVDTVWLSDPDAETLRGLFHHAAKLWANGDRPPLVTTASVPAFGQDVLGPAGLRRTASQFNCYLCAADPSHPLLAAEATNLEVV